MGRYSNRGEIASHLGELAHMSPEPVSIVRKASKKVQHRLRSEEAKQLVIDYQAGAPIKDLVARYGVDQSTVTQHVKRAGARLRYPKLLPHEIDEAARLYRSGQSLAVVAVKFGVDPHTVRGALLKLGVEMRAQQSRRQ
jgi:hypothetical protein